MRSVNTEAQLYEQLAQYLIRQHPELAGMFHFDLAGVNNPSKYSRALYGRLNRRAWPDLFIAVPTLQPGTVNVYHGLFIELKREGFKLKKRDGTWVKEHIAEQYAMLVALSEQGYIAQFAVGFDEAVELIEDYLNASRQVPDPSGTAVF